MAKQFRNVDWSNDWLQNKTSLGEVEAGQEQRPGGRPASEWWQQKWNEFRSHVQPEDEVWEYATPRPYWDQGFGHAGCALLRDGVLVTRMVRIFN